MKGLARLGLPLLAKELLEQAARRRTYIVRTAYASLLFIAFFVIFSNRLRAVSATPMTMLGSGRAMFELLVALQFAGVYLFAPALACGTITQEKERASLQLLFLTRLGPWTIVFEKFLSRLIPIVGFLMLSLPLLAFAYSLGGISPQHLGAGVWLLLVSAVQIVALALACSAYFRTTSTAFVAAYLFELLLFFGPTAIGKAFFPFPVYPLFGLRLFLQGGFAGFARPAVPSFLATVVESTPLLVSCAAFLVAARFFLVRRAFVPPRNLMLNVFGWLDRLFQRWNQNRWTKGIVLIADSGSLPGDQPIAWRETTKRSLGQARYLLRIFLAIEVPLLVLCLLISVSGPGNTVEIARVLILPLWGLAVLMVSVQSASLIAAEKSRQSFDVLCTTPFTSREIIRQKFCGVRRLIVVLLVPMLTVTIFQTWWRVLRYNYYGVVSGSGSGPSPSAYLISATLISLIYLPLVGWLSLWIGLKTKSQARAIIGSLAAIVGWCVLPVFCCIFPVAWLWHGDQSVILILLTTPVAQIVLNEIGGPPPVLRTPVPLILNCLIYGSALFFFRGMCLTNAGELLGRLDDSDEPAPADAVPAALAGMSKDGSRASSNDAVSGP